MSFRTLKILALVISAVTSLAILYYLGRLALTALVPFVAGYLTGHYIPVHRLLARKEPKDEPEQSTSD